MQNQSLSNEICRGSFHENQPFFTNHFSAKLVSKIPAKFPRNQPFFSTNLSMKILRNLTSFHNLPEALCYMYLQLKQGIGLAVYSRSNLIGVKYMHLSLTHSPIDLSIAYSTR